MSDVNIWELRYRDLEQTLEQMLLKFGQTLSQLEARSTRSPSQFKIRKLTRTCQSGQDLLCCVADGENLEYRFLFFNNGESDLGSETPFQRSNSFPITEELIAHTVRCRVEVRSNLPGLEQQVLSREVAL